MDRPTPASPSPAAPSPSAPRLLDEVRRHIRLRRYAYNTEQNYMHWVCAFVRFHGLKHPRTLGLAQVENFLSHPAAELHVAASTLNQAKAALLYLYRYVLQVDLPWRNDVVAAHRPRRLPIVLTRADVRALLAVLNGQGWLITSLLYLTGMRAIEALRLRVKDIDLERREIVVRGGKGGKDRVTVVPENPVLAPHDKFVPVRDAPAARSRRSLGRQV